MSMEKVWVHQNKDGSFSVRTTSNVAVYISVEIEPTISKAVLSLPLAHSYWADDEFGCLIFRPNPIHYGGTGVSH